MFQFLLKTNSLLHISLVLTRTIPKSINSYLLLIKNIVLSMNVLNLQAPSLISQKTFDNVWHDGTIFQTNSKWHIGKFN